MAHARPCRWALFQGCVFALQNSYQRKRTYTRIALGRGSAMDVASGEASVALASGSTLRALFPALYALQALQAHCGATVLAAGLLGGPRRGCDRRSGGGRRSITA